MPSARPRLTVIVPCYNSARTIRRCLASLRAQATTTAFDVLVVDSSTDDTAAIVAREFPWARLVRRSRRTYAGHARNIGIRATDAPYCLMLDSDCVAPPTLVEAMLHRLDTETCDAVGAALRNGTPRSVTGWLGYLLEFREFMPSTPRRLARTVPTAAVCYRRDVFERFGYFDEDAALAEDLILHADIARGGGRILFDPTIEATHLNRTGWREVLGYQYRCGMLAADARRRGVDEGRIALRWPLLALAFPLPRLLRAARWLCAHDRRAFGVFVALAPAYVLALAVWSVGFWREARRGATAPRAKELGHGQAAG